MNIFIYLLIFNVEVKAFNRQKALSLCSREKSFLTTVMDHKEKNEEIKNEERNNCDCERRFGIVQKIVYSKNADSVNIPFSSACIRCGLCLVIADKINKTLVDVHDVMSPNAVQWLNNTEVDALLEAICNQSFIQLREINGERFIGESLPGSLLIESTADRLWELELKNKCIELVEDIGTANVYKYWLEWYYEAQDKDFAQIFCQGNEGIFHDCRSFEKNRMKTDSSQDPDLFQVEIKSRSVFSCL